MGILANRRPVFILIHIMFYAWIIEVEECIKIFWETNFEKINIYLYMCKTRWVIYFNCILIYSELVKLVVITLHSRFSKSGPQNWIFRKSFRMKDDEWSSHINNCVSSMFSEIFHCKVCGEVCILKSFLFINIIHMYKHNIYMYIHIYIQIWTINICNYLPATAW